LRLKSLEIKGFKSFADKTVILLDNAITGIVGPNGCGKSNIVDAIRWVIGEHKIKSLRSDNLEDLIFNGSRTRAGSGLAEVSLTFENTRNLLPTDFTTVTITRKFYKNGESEYKLNDVTCRLKDIHNLFLDTGVSNDSYAIIELAMVDDIIKDKEGARRRMLEQAAGISIYKTRKKETKQKLESTEIDLARIEDLLFEIANNLKTLEVQAKKAEKYFSVKNEYKEASVELAKATLEKFGEQFKTLNEQQEELQNKKATIDTAVAAEEAAIEVKKLQLISNDEELKKQQKQFNELNLLIRQLENDRKLDIQKLQHTKEKEKTIRDFLKNASVQLEKYEATINESQGVLKTETAVLEQIKAELDALKIAVEEKRKAFEDKKKALEIIRNDYQQKQRSQFEAEKRIAVAEVSNTSVQKNIRQVQDEIAQRSSQVAALDKEHQDCIVKLNIKKSELAQMSGSQEELKNNIKQTQEKLEKLKNDLAAENRKYDARKNEHDLLKSLVDSLEGYPESIKFLKKSLEWDNTSPLLSDVFVVQNEYRTAVENVLDSYLNYYVVDNIEQAVAAINLLERNKKGKANFFLLDAINNDVLDSVVKPEGTVSVLDVVTFDERYNKLAAMVLGHVFVAEREGWEPVGLCPDKCIVVSRDGKKVFGRYTAGGGSIGVFEGNKIGRAKNLERLAAEIANLRNATTVLKTAINDCTTLIGKQNSELNDRLIEQTKQEINRLQNLAINLEHKKENFDHLNTSGHKKIADLKTQSEAAQAQVAALKADAENFTVELAKLQQAIQDSERDFRTVDLGYNEANQKYNQHNINYTRQHSKLDGLKQELRFRTNQMNELKKQIDTNKNQSETNLIQIANIEKQLAENELKTADSLKKKEVDEKELNENDRQYHLLRNDISAREGNLNQGRREKDQADTLLAGIKDRINEMKLQVEGIKQKLSIEFNLNINDIIDEARKNHKKIEDLTADAEKIKKRLDNMGEINPTAIEAFTEIKVRHEFIKTQRADLVQAKESLLATLNEVETTANTKFTNTFNLVRENFVQVFKALFTADDNCDLRLTEPDNVAESGIEIYAQPKGKKPSTLTQLSGGEKTLTSTAFLFAIYLIKPAPFCILDEVDAPLDDANVGKFTQMIRKFSDNSQFIIVTHNKQTMAAVDVIYGVTMQEAGVSKLVPVDFRSLN
jgi:chromosome segregation protein